MPWRISVPCTFDRRGPPRSNRARCCSRLICRRRSRRHCPPHRYRAAQTDSPWQRPSLQTGQSLGAAAVPSCALSDPKPPQPGVFTVSGRMIEPRDAHAVIALIEQIILIVGRAVDGLLVIHPCALFGKELRLNPDGVIEIERGDSLKGHAHHFLICFMFFGQAKPEQNAGRSCHNSILPHIQPPGNRKNGIEKWKACAAEGRKSPLPACPDCAIIITNHIHLQRRGDDR